MSRVRTRPTREETRARLFAAAAEEFAALGVGAATVEDITGTAGFTRGAFYSNFTSKDELILAMIEDHVARSARWNLELLARHPDPVEFMEALATERDLSDPLAGSPLLQMELLLHAARTPEHRPALARRLRTMRSLIGEIAVTTMAAAGVHDVDAEEAGALLLALEDGFRLHRLIDPVSTPPDAFARAVRGLQRLAIDRSSPGNGADRT